MDLVSYLKKFFTKHCPGSRPLLLGYSGGTDSSVLFEMLLDAKIPFIAAHVDHGWRESSAAEAKLLEARAAAHQIPFYSIRLNLEGEKGNLEEICRNKRYAFFKELVDKLDVQALCLAHHRDDNMETTLTRFLQGYSLHHLTGMSPAGFAHGLPIVRPFLNVSKNELMKYPLKYPVIEDPTNQDKKFLRARIRALQETLGKEIEGPIARISQESEDLKKFMELHLGEILKTATPICCGNWLDLSSYSLSRFEFRYLIREFLRLGKVVFSHHLVESALEALEVGKANHVVQGHEAQLVVDRKQLFLVKKIPEIKWVAGDGPEVLGWQPFLRGQLTVFVPEGARLIPCEKRLSDIWNNCHVPAFLRGWVPVVQMPNGQVKELLSGRKSSQGPVVQEMQGVFYCAVVS